MGELVELPGYDDLLASVSDVVSQWQALDRATASRTRVVTCWTIGRLITQFEQGTPAGSIPAGALVNQLGADLADRVGLGFPASELRYCRRFYNLWPPDEVLQRPYVRHLRPKPCPVTGAIPDNCGVPDPAVLAEMLPLSWVAYQRLMAVADDDARLYYEMEALRSRMSATDVTAMIRRKKYERSRPAQR